MKVELNPNMKESIDDEGNWMYHVELRNLWKRHDRTL
jgi:hypothetical protein